MVAHAQSPAAKPPGRPAKAKPGRPPVKSNNAAVPYTMNEEDQVPDMIRQKIDRLKAFKIIDEEFKEPMSMDWRSEWRLQDSMFEKIKKQSSFHPRLGELVLFVRGLGGKEICLEDTTNQYKIYSPKRQKFIGHPTWEAGVIAQVPEEPVQLQDILADTRKNQNVTCSGFRVEPLPDPNSLDKRLSKKFAYVLFQHTRPLSFYRDCLKGIPEDEWHITVKHALKVMASISVTSKFYCKGNWPDLTILCKGMYIGAELVAQEDAVRILPAGNETTEDLLVTDVLHIKSIKCKITNLDRASDDDDDDGHPYNTTVLVSGKAYTSSPSKAWSNLPIARKEAYSLNLPSGMNGYNDWYQLHDPKMFYQTSFRNVFGRCYEGDAMHLWFPPTANMSVKANLSRGLDSILEARQFSKEKDARIHESKSFYIADSRGEALDLHEFNSVRLSSHDGERTSERLESWYNATKIIEKSAGNKEKVNLKHLVGTSGPGASGAIAEAGAMAPNTRVAIDEDSQDDDEEQNDLDRAKLSQRFGILQTSSLLGAANSPLGKRSRSVADDEIIYPSDSAGSSGTSGINSGDPNKDQDREMTESSDNVKDVAMSNSSDSKPSHKVDKGKGKARAPVLGESSGSSSINVSSEEMSNEKKKKKKLGGWLSGLRFASGSGD
ncbi:MAG: hypothetical protein M1831_007493 [Alyxoria varia]|nr:MAG: hypothetical protein M1831_007493 [Alyxoria varia]